MNYAPPPKRSPVLAGAQVAWQGVSDVRYRRGEVVTSVGPIAPRGRVQDRANGGPSNLPPESGAGIESKSERGCREATGIAENELSGIPDKVLLPPCGIAVGG